MPPAHAVEKVQRMDAAGPVKYGIGCKDGGVRRMISNAGAQRPAGSAATTEKTT